MTRTRVYHYFPSSPFLFLLFLTIITPSRTNARSLVFPRIVFKAALAKLLSSDDNSTRLSRKNVRNSVCSYLLTGQLVRSIIVRNSKRLLPPLLVRDLHFHYAYYLQHCNRSTLSRFEEASMMTDNTECYVKKSKMSYC